MKFTIACLYAPTNVTQRKHFLKKTGTVLRNNIGDPFWVLISGNFNTIDIIEDRTSNKPDGSSTQFTNFKKSLNLTDTWHCKNQNNFHNDYGVSYKHTWLDP